MTPFDDTGTGAPWLANDNAGRFGIKSIPVIQSFRKTPPSEHLVCLDVETVPDREVLPAEWDPAKFPKPTCHKVVAISVTTARIEREEFDGPETYHIAEIRSGGEIDWDEGTLLRSFWRYFEEITPRLVTFNGRSFDVPVLRQRAMIYGIPTPAWYRCGDKWSSYSSRFSDAWHSDLCELMCDFGASARLSLEELTRAIGLPGKAGEHGSLVEEMIAAGDVERVRRYCETDTLNTYLGYLRWALASGRSTPETYNRSVESAVAYLEEQAHRPHLAAFLETWRSSPRPAPMMVREPRARQ